jgi:PAS domain S-box-containing protein
VNDPLTTSMHVEMCRAALDALPEAVLIYDEERVLYANSAAARLLGGSSNAELDGLPVQGFILPDLAEVNNARRAMVLNQGIELRDLVVKVRGLDGSPVVLHVDITQIFFDGSSAAMATVARRS